MALYVTQPRRDEVRIGRGLPSGLGCTEALDLCLRDTFCDAVILFTVQTNLRFIK